MSSIISVLPFTQQKYCNDAKCKRRICTHLRPILTVNHCVSTCNKDVNTSFLLYPWNGTKVEFQVSTINRVNRSHLECTTLYISRSPSTFIMHFCEMGLEARVHHASSSHSSLTVGWIEDHLRLVCIVNGCEKFCTKITFLSGPRVNGHNKFKLIWVRSTGGHESHTSFHWIGINEGTVYERTSHPSVCFPSLVTVAYF